ncbi:hypothetical protein D3C79_590030 [compost metagenome]
MEESVAHCQRAFVPDCEIVIEDLVVHGVDEGAFQDSFFRVDARIVNDAIEISMQHGEGEVARANVNILDTGTHCGLTPVIVVGHIDVVIALVLADTRPCGFALAHEVAQLHVHVFPAEGTIVGVAVGIAVPHVEHGLYIDGAIIFVIQLGSETDLGVVIKLVADTAYFIFLERVAANVVFHAAIGTTRNTGSKIAKEINVLGCSGQNVSGRCPLGRHAIRCPEGECGGNHGVTDRFFHNSKSLSLVM